MNVHRALRAGLLMLFLLGSGMVWPQLALPSQAGISSDSVSARSQAVQRALAWLSLQQQADGGFGSAGQSEWKPTASVAITYLIAGEDASILVGSAGKSPVDYLASRSVAIGSDAYDVSQMILAGVSLGLDPTSFGGRNWSSELTATYQSEGRYAGASAGAVQTQVSALMALRATYQPVPTQAIAWLKSAASGDGGWGAQPGGLSDVYHTGLVLHALALAGEPPTSTVMRGAIAYLLQRQTVDGGFALKAGETAMDLLATSAAVPGLIAAGEDLFDPPWAVNGRSVFQATLQKQLANGAFESPTPGESDIASTTAGIQILIARSMPLRHPLLAAYHALEWLRTQQLPDGSFGPGNTTSEAVYAISLAGQDAGSIAWTRGITSALAALEAQMPVYVGGRGNRAAEAGKAARAVVAAGRDPRSFGGFDLVARIQSFYDPVTGRYHPTHLYRNNLALLGLIAAGAPIPQQAIETLTDAQGEGGGWGWASSTTPDMDTTGQTMHTLAASGYPPYGDDLERATLFVASWQLADGSLVDRSGAVAGNSNSTALATEGLLALRRDPRDAPYRIIGDGGEVLNLLDALLAFQEDSGAFVFMHDMSESRLMAVLDAVPALLASYPAYQPAHRAHLPLMIE